MRICICGLHREDAVKKAEDALGVESVNVDFPGMESEPNKLFYNAALSFKYFEKNNVVFDGGVFDEDNFKLYADVGWAELQEQIILSVIANLDYIVIIKEGMDEKRVKFCQSFADIYPNKFVMINTGSELEIG